MANKVINRTYGRNDSSMQRNKNLYVFVPAAKRSFRVSGMWQAKGNNNNAGCVCVRMVERDIIDELIIDVHVYDGIGAVVHILPCVYRTNIKNNSPNEPCERYNS